MARYNEVKIDTVYLTSTGLVGGKPCKVNVPGLEQLQTTKTGQVANSANGTPYLQLIDFEHRGIKIQVETEWMSKTVYDSIVAIHEASKNGGTTIPIEISGDTGDFTFDVVCAIPQDISFEGFSNEYIRRAVFRYVIT